MRITSAIFFQSKLFQNCNCSPMPLNSFKPWASKQVISHQWVCPETGMPIYIECKERLSFRSCEFWWVSILISLVALTGKWRQPLAAPSPPHSQDFRELGGKNGSPSFSYCTLIVILASLSLLIQFPKVFPAEREMDSVRSLVICSHRVERKLLTMGLP